MSTLDDIIAQAADDYKKMRADPDCWQITIRTMDADDAGTDANIRFQLMWQGVNHPNSGRKPDLTQLKEGPWHSFCASDEQNDLGYDYFVEPIPEGYQPRSITIQHDNSGHKPGWLIERLTLILKGKRTHRVYIGLSDPAGYWISADDRNCNVEFDDQQLINSVSRTFWILFGDQVNADPHQFDPNA